MIILALRKLLILFTSYSHAAFSLPASGLRLETVKTSDKKKPEVYFQSSSRKILTLFSPATAGPNTISALRTRV